jgi:methyltransferase (TIGR00027 family)
VAETSEPPERDDTPTRAPAPADVTDTAGAIARIRDAERTLPLDERLFDDPFARLFGGGAASAEVMARFLTAPFFREHIRLRTRFIDDFVRQGLADGFRQIVVLGAGFDCRALRMEEIVGAGAIVFEVDLAGQLDAKRTILQRAAITIPSFVRLIPGDLEDEDASHLARDLTHGDFRSNRPTLFVCEGIVSYLRDTALARMFDGIVHAAPAGARLVFNYPLTRLAPNQVAARLTTAGFARVEDHALDAIHRRYLRREPPPGGEFYRIAVAST